MGSVPQYVVLAGLVATGLGVLAGTTGWMPPGAEGPPGGVEGGNLSDLQAAPTPKPRPTDPGAIIRGVSKTVSADGEPAQGPSVVERTPTPLTEVELAEVLYQAHELEFGEPPTDLRWGVAWAHLALEHQRGKAIENHNFGNISVWEKEPYPHYVRILKERKRAMHGAAFGRWRWVEMRFRAFPDHLTGARTYWRHLNEHYTRALVLFSVGNGRDAGLKLARDGYATANAEPYADSINNLNGEFKLEILPRVRKDRPKKE